MLAAVDIPAKRTMAVTYEVAFLRTEVSALRKANERLSKRRRAEKNRCAAWRITYRTRRTRSITSERGG